MKLRLLIVPCLIGLLSGCVTLERTGLLFTPIGVAGVHSFASPDDSARTPDNMKRLERIANQKAGEQAGNVPEG